MSTSNQPEGTPRPHDAAQDPNAASSHEATAADAAAVTGRADGTAAAALPPRARRNGVVGGRSATNPPCGAARPAGPWPAVNPC